MSIKFLFAAAFAAVLATPALAADMHDHDGQANATLGDLTIMHAYARVSSPVAKSGAAFFVIENAGDKPDQLVAASSDAAARVELHTHKETDGVMKMMEVEGGFPVPAHGAHMLARGGDHVMFMGLPKAWEHGSEVTVTLTFRDAGDVTFQIPVDLERLPEDNPHQHMTHGD